MGTNSFHLLVARADEKGYLHILDTHKESVRFGEVPPFSDIPEEKIQLAIAALSRMKEIANKYQPTYRIVATQATRSAPNYQEVIDRIRSATDLKVEIIDGLEEARLTYLGLQYCHESTKDITLGMDIGGGSTEIVIGRGEEILFMTSLKLGALTTSKRFFDIHAPDASKIERLKDYILTRIAPLKIDADSFVIQRAFATSGTAKAIGRLHHFESRSQELENPNGYHFPASDLAKLERNLCQLATPDKIRGQYPLDLKRSEIILAGTLIFSKISELFQVPTWNISTYGIREGIVLDTYARLHVQLNTEAVNQQWKSLESFAHRLQLDVDFANEIRTLSLDLFDQIINCFPKTQLPKNVSSYRNLLAAAAYLNESGKFISFTSHHKHSYYLISKASLLGFSREEKHIVALINRFSRKKLANRQSIQKYPYLKNKVDLINFLSCCIRASRSATRSRLHKVTSVQVDWKHMAPTVTFVYKQGENIDAETQALRTEQKNLAKVWGDNTNIIIKRQD